MSSRNLPETSDQSSAWLKGAYAIVLTILALLIITLLGLALGYTPIEFIGKVLNKLFAANSIQTMWYVTRAAGLTAYLLVWLSTVWGLGVSSKIFDPVLQRVFTYDFHQFLSLLAIGFIILHIVVLAADQYLPFSIAQILVPFIAPYRPVWVGIGVFGFYLTILVSITFYIRRQIGQKTFRVIHYASFIAFAFSALHGLFAGTDSPLWMTQAMYLVTSLTVVFLTAYRIFASMLKGRRSLS